MDNSALIGVGGVVLGVVLGFGLNWWRETRHTANVSRNVRNLLRLECHQNVKALLDYWGKVSVDGVHLPDVGTLVGVGTSPQEGEYDKRQRLAREPMPVWSRLMWENQTGMVAQALNDPALISRVYTLYADLEAFTARRQELREAFDTAEGLLLAKDYSRWMQSRQAWQGNPNYREEQGTETKLSAFNEETRTLWNECDAIYKRAVPYRNNDVIPEGRVLRPLPSLLKALRPKL